MTYFAFRDKYIFWGLTISLIFSFILTPFFKESVRPFNIFIIASLFFAIGAISISKGRLFLTLSIGTPFFLFIILSSYFENLFILTGFYILAVLFFLLIIILLLQDIFSDTHVDTNHLLASICIYLCIAIVWAMLYGMIDLYFKNTFDIAGDVSFQTHLNDLMYFSVVTLTTLGYGDITPLSAPTKSLAAMQALIGQIYLTVLVARLVGLHIASNSSYKRKNYES